jgi:hypothetical protein
MEQVKNEKKEACLQEYPKALILGRLILLGIIFVSGVYTFYQLKAELSFIYVFYSLLIISLVLPLSRCVFCSYHGKLCNVGWGKIAGWIFPKKTEKNFTSGYDYMLFIYPIWLFPLLGSLVQLARFRSLFWLAFSLGYILILVLEKVYLKNSGCRFCAQRKICPGVPFRSEEIS